MEVYRHAFAFAGRTATLARRAEDLGYTGLLVADSQSLNADVWVELGLAAAATRRLALGPGVTNPATRHPAVTASAAATLQVVSHGRAVLGLGRGDSALLQIGRRPVPVAELEAGLVALQDYLAGGIAWVARSGEAKVPVAVAATGPHVIAAAARHAERIDFTVGAEPERMRWAIETARAAAAGRAVSFGAYLNVGVDADRARARDLVRGSTAILARFGTEGAPPDGLSEVTRTGIERLAAAYDESRHGEGAADHARALEDEFIDRFAVVGPPGEVADRLRELAALGLDRIIAVHGSLDADPADVEAADERFAADVLPALRA